MHKSKRGDINWNRILQWVLIALIVFIVLTQFNLWAFWWLPFLFFGVGGCCRGVCSGNHNSTRKRKTDEVDYV